MRSSPPRRDAGLLRLRRHWACSHGLFRRSREPPPDVPRRAPRIRHPPPSHSCRRRRPRWHERGRLLHEHRQGRATGPGCNPAPLWQNCALSQRSPRPPTAVAGHSDCAPGACRSQPCRQSDRSSGRGRKPAPLLHPDLRQALFPRHPTVPRVPAGYAVRPCPTVAMLRSA